MLKNNESSVIGRYLFSISWFLWSATGRSSLKLLFEELQGEWLMMVVSLQK